ncbi:MAG TPA: N-acetyltransferase [bacterium]|nr:N-acetyltransferase [bacterium]
MNNVMTIHTAKELERHLERPVYQGFDATVLERHRPDEHLLLDADGEARCSLWWSEVPQLPGERLGVLGHFAATSREAALRLFQAAFERLSDQGCTLAIGPMDGNTWRAYRLVSERGMEPPFFLEPNNPPEWPEWFEAAGFTPLARYVSALNGDLAHQDERVPRTLARLQSSGVQFRPLNLARLDDELLAIHRLSLTSFADNFLYTALEVTDFIKQYRSLLPKLDAELILLAERDGALVGYLFALPDFNQPLAGLPLDTCIIKTIAVLPGRENAGLGAVLAAKCQDIARMKGYRRVIHALMHEHNDSLKLSARYARVMRRYTLYQARLLPT